MQQTATKRKAITSLLVSSLILILLFVGVSTATYAWYSAVNRAIGDSITFTSSTSDQIGGDLAIGWSSISTANNISFDMPDSNLYPMIPKIAAEIGMTTYSQFTTTNFNSCAQAYNETLRKWLCSFSGQDADPYICKGTVTIDTPVTYNYFYLINKKADKKQTITVRYSLSGILADTLHVALFMGDPVDGASDSDTISNTRLLGIMSSSDNIYYDTITENDVVEDTPLMENVYRESGTMVFVINEGAYKCCTLVAWLDGVAIDNNDIEQTTTFNITFEGILGDLLG